MKKKEEEDARRAARKVEEDERRALKKAEDEKLKLKKLGVSKGQASFFAKFVRRLRHCSRPAAAAAAAAAPGGVYVRSLPLPLTV